MEKNKLIDELLDEIKRLNTFLQDEGYRVNWNQYECWYRESIFAE